MEQIEPQEVDDRRKAGEQLILLDVRTPQEVAFCSIPNSLHVPMNEIPFRLDELDREQTYVVYCRTGVRSAKVCQLLSAHGFKHAANLRGGIDAWSVQVDPSIPRYR